MTKPLYRNYVLVMLLLVYLISLIDRQILAALIEPIRLELQLSDTQLGLLSGLAFGLLYATMALPLARLGDRWSRTKLIGGCLTIWSVATMLCGAASSFFQLFAARVVVGTGEAGAGPSSHALISDYFPVERRATALGIYSSGIFVGAGLGLFLGGVFLAEFGWRGAFVAAGVPGLIVSLIFVLTVREPAGGEHAQRPEVPPFLASMREIVQSRPLVAGAFALGFSVFTMQSLLNWLPALLARDYGFAPQDASRAIAPIVALACTLGVILGGIASDRAARAAPANSPTVMGIATLLIVPFGVAGLLSGSSAILLAAMVPTFFCCAFVAGPSFAIFQNYAPPNLRALASAAAGLVAAVLGAAMGPFGGGVLSDVYAGMGVDRPLLWSLVTCCFAAALSALAYFAAAGAIRRQIPSA